jgi:hypothetical protein
MASRRCGEVVAVMKHANLLRQKAFRETSRESGELDIGRGVGAEMLNLKDCMAERGGFEPPVPVLAGTTV